MHQQPNAAAPKAKAVFKLLFPDTEYLHLDHAIVRQSFMMQKVTSAHDGLGLPRLKSKASPETVMHMINLCHFINDYDVTPLLKGEIQREHPVTWYLTRLSSSEELWNVYQAAHEFLVLALIECCTNFIFVNCRLAMRSRSKDFIRKTYPFFDKLAEDDQERFLEKENQ